MTTTANVFEKGTDTNQLTKEQIEEVIVNLENWVIKSKELAIVLRYLYTQLGTSQTQNNATEEVVQNTTENLEQVLEKEKPIKSEEEKQKIFNKLDESSVDHVLSKIISEENWPRRAELLQYYFKRCHKQNVKIEYIDGEDYIFTGMNWVSIKIGFNEDDRLFIQRHWSDEWHQISTSYKFEDKDLKYLIFLDQVIWETFENWWIVDYITPFVVNTNNYNNIIKITVQIKDDTLVEKLLVNNNLEFQIENNFSIERDNLEGLLNNLWKYHYDNKNELFENLPTHEQSTFQ